MSPLENLRRLQLARAPDSNANKAVGIGQGYSGTTVTIVYDAQLHNKVETLEKEVQEIKEAFLMEKT